MDHWSDWIDLGRRLPNDWPQRWQRFWHGLRAAANDSDERSLAAAARQQLGAMNCPPSQFQRLIDRLREDETDTSARVRLQRLLTGIWNALLPDAPIDTDVARRYGLPCWPLFAKLEDEPAPWVPTPEDLSRLMELLPGARLADVLEHLQQGEAVDRLLDRLRERITQARDLGLPEWRALLSRYRQEPSARRHVDAIINDLLRRP